MNLAAIPPTVDGSTVHLHVPGYEPGKKHRSMAAKSPMCGAALGAYATAPLADVLARVDIHDTPRPWRLCRSCVGHAAAYVGITDQVVDMIRRQVST